jgi:tRNA (cytidine/uridine-2'-O-)-methyltransferase
LVKPLGFSLEDRQLKRAGLDYWNEVDLCTWESVAELQAAQARAARYFYLTTKTRRAYWDAEFRRGDFLVFGRETKGLPESLLTVNIDDCITIPMCTTRSYCALRSSAAIALRTPWRSNLADKILA